MNKRKQFMLLFMPSIVPFFVIFIGLLMENRFEAEASRYYVLGVISLLAYCICNFLAHVAANSIKEDSFKLDKYH